MRKPIIFILLFLLMGLSQAQVRRGRRPLIELGPKVSLYLGHNTRFSLGAEVIVNPLRNLGLRIDLTELSFGEGDTDFFLNLRDISIDGILYIPAQGIKPYVFVGFGVAADGRTDVAFRGGVGLNYSITRGSDLFVEPGAVILYNSLSDETRVWFRLSLGGRFGLTQ
ncbi:hypothetical protein AMJ83_11530 [candidate division WOR_3 bacterium SM23_42]|uniref:Outer membrane protein beta-barrel domain-containing protein n=1 Tax=candidate division WOR_3 bacterium SM23_42 TaxID=1703779 RepID=A0A0S8FN46_UNCW3|nr:MAG: hypothetical protein AMJ83_11530 [candidate division WOR_3 bacterium SM23_42]